MHTLGKREGQPYVGSNPTSSAMKIAICGSMKFIGKMQLLKNKLEKSGHIVFAPEVEGEKLDWNKLTSEEQIKLKKYYIDTQIEKIKQVDSILVANYNQKNITGYIGPNSYLEIAFAYVLNKKIFLLNSIPKQDFELELRALKPYELNGKLNQLKF